MKKNIEKYTINAKNSLFDALNKININKKGFLIVLKDNKILGTLTDGDIRRALIRNKNLSSFVEECTVTEFKYLHVSDNIGDAIELFKNESIKFLPIVEDYDILSNIILKNQMHALLLQDIHVDLKYDFESIDENMVDYEIFQRPWGFYKTTVMNDYCQSKIICIYPGEKISLQSHKRREEHWIIVHGIGLIQIGESIIDASKGDVYFIPKGCKHRLTNKSACENLIITEVQIGDYFGEDDIYRYEDEYDRL